MKTSLSVILGHVLEVRLTFGKFLALQLFYKPADIPDILKKANTFKQIPVSEAI